MTWQEKQLMDQFIAYKLVEAQLMQQSLMSSKPYLIPYPQIIQANLMDLSQTNSIKYCCEKTFDKINATWVERERIIEYHLRSCVQAYPKVILEKPNQETRNKKNKISLNILKICCVLLAVTSRFISHITFRVFSPLLIILNLVVCVGIITVSLGICSLEKNQ